ncbi:DUF1501 domain-containing protein [Schlesneria paludicola]|uniref:DUF1501 domain-containing protein n=1 Tax=Schlesneria paludicola TaxID=360056 RepID=UPI000299F037|nr:DUF1501 domain-containing protein [Schlesneria paludicola]
MLTVLGDSAKLCDGVTRREIMRVGGLSLFAGMSLPGYLRATESSATTRPGRAKSVVLFNLLGGPSQMDMFDLKPNAPVEVRGEFLPIATSVDGLQICEHLPNVAKLMHKTTLIRTVSHGYNAHNPLPIMTGFTGGNFGQLKADPTDPPDVGAICQYLGLGPRNLPGAVCLPCYPGWGESSMYAGLRRPGPYGGFLGSQYDPLFAVCDPKFGREPTVKFYDPVLPIGDPQLPSVDELPDITVNRLSRRRSMLDQLDTQFAKTRQSGSIDRLSLFQQTAFDMLTSSKTRDAFDLSQESADTRDRYGRNLSGSSMLVARRLVEVGVPFISVHAEIFGKYGHSYDMHENNFGMLKDYNLPILDQCVPALIEDLDSRGLLDSTLVIVMGEMGRAPKINSKAGRDHWPQCGFSLLAGGGVKRGFVYGETDKQAAYPISHAVSPGDLVATIYQQLGIDPHLTVRDQTGRPIGISHGGEPITEIIA